MKDALKAFQTAKDNKMRTIFHTQKRIYLHILLIYHNLRNGLLIFMTFCLLLFPEAVLTKDDRRKKVTMTQNKRLSTK